MSKQFNLTFSLEGLIREDKDTSCFVSYCPALDLYSAGKTRPKAKAALQSAIDMFIRICFERQTLGRVLAAKGFAMAPAHERVTDGQFIAIAATEQPSAVTVQGTEYDDRFMVEIPMAMIAQQAQRQALTV